MNEDNEAGIRLLETHGFDREGTLRDQEYADGGYVNVYHYGLLAGDRR